MIRHFPDALRPGNGIVTSLIYVVHRVMREPRLFRSWKEEDGISRKRYIPEQIIRRLQEAEILLSQGRKTGEVCRRLGDLPWEKWSRRHVMYGRPRYHRDRSRRPATRRHDDRGTGRGGQPSPRLARPEQATALRLVAKAPVFSAKIAPRNHQTEKSGTNRALNRLFRVSSLADQSSIRQQRPRKPGPFAVL